MCKEIGERRVVLHLLVLLHNCQTSEVGINQILNTFMSKTKGFKKCGFACKNDGTELELVSENANGCFQ